MFNNLDATSSTATTEPASASPAGTIVQATATVTVLSTPTSATLASNSSRSPSSTTLSIVIGVLVPSMGLLMLLAAWVLWKKHKRTMEKLLIQPEVNRQSPAKSPSFYPKSMDPNYVYSMEISPLERPAEIPTTENPTEVCAYPMPVELPVGTFRSGL